jgi:Xaa-Pro aminopeptidase
MKALTVTVMFFVGMINAHIRDAVAMCSYFAWLEKEVLTGTVTEISGAKKLEQFRR